MQVTVWCVVGVLAVLGLAFVAVYNRIVALANRCDQAAADIDVQLKHRHDLIPRLVDCVRGFLDHESGIVEQVVSARRSAVSAATPAAQAAAEEMLGVRLGQLIVTINTYPEIQASAHFAHLREEIVDTEHKLAAARRFLNRAVSEYNTSLQQLPGSLIAAFFRIGQRRPFDLGIDRVFLDDGPAVKL